MNSRSGKSKRPSLQSPTGASAWEATVRVVAVIAVLVLSASLLANSMTKEVGRDEQVYCTAGVLLSQGKMIYRDFSYPGHLPYHPLLLAALYRGLGTTHYLLVGRILSAACDILVVLLIIQIYRSIFVRYRMEGLLFGLAAAVLYVFNPLVDYAAGYAWNHDVVILCVVLAVWLFVTTDFQHGPRDWRTAAMGALLAFATCMRVTTALAAIVVLVMLLATIPGSWRARGRVALPFLVAGLIVCLWPVWVILHAPQAFLLNLVRIPSLIAAWLQEIHMAFGKVALTVAALTMPGYLMLLVLAGFLGWIGVRLRSSQDVQEKRKATLAALLPVVFLVIAYIPPTMWHQYLAVPVPFAAIAFAYPLVWLRRRAEKGDGKISYKAACYLSVTAAAISIFAYPVVLYRSLAVLVPEMWVPVKMHGLSAEVTATMKGREPVLTLGPLYALEGGRDIYPELSCGSVIYRVADRVTPEERRITHTVGPDSLRELVQDRPPSGVIVGIEAPRFSFLEDPLRRLVPPAWPRTTTENGLQVYTRP